MQIVPAISSKTIDRYYGILREYGTHVFVPDGATFKELVSNTSGLGTNTAQSPTRDNFGVAGVYFDGSAQLDASSVFSGAIPGNLTFSAWVAFDNWDNGANQYLLSILASAGNEYRLFKFSSDALFLYHNQGGALTQTFIDVSGLVGVHHVGVTLSGSFIGIYIDGLLVASASPSGAPTGTMTRQLIGAQTTSTLKLVGSMFDVLLNDKRALSAGEMAELYQEGLA